MLATVVLLLLNVAVYVVMLVDGGTEQLGGFSPALVMRYGANYAPSVVDGAQLWRLFTSTLEHLSAQHILMNMVALWQVGRMLERRWGTTRLVIAYTLTGVLASVTSLAWYGFLQPALLGIAAVPAAGASGAICGLIGATVVAFHSVGGVAGRQIRNGMLRWGLIVIAYGFFVGADNAAHIGGFLAGLLLGLVVERAFLQQHTSRALDLAAVVGFIAAAGAAFALALDWI